MPLVRKLVLFLGVLGVFGGAQADTYIRDAFRDIRWLGRGNTGVATIRDGTSLFYNPAGISRTDSYNFSVFNPSFGLNLNVLTSLASIFGLAGGGESLSSRFAPFLDKPLLLSGSIFPHFALPGFALGIFDYLDVFMSYENPVFPSLRLDARNDMGIITGFGFSIFRGLHFGVSLRYVKRTSAYTTVTGDQLLLNNSSLITDLVKRGQTFGINAGLQYRYNFSSAHWVSFGTVVEDIGYSRFFGNTAALLPDPQIQMLNAGVAYGFDLSLVSMQVLVDAKQLLNSGLSFSKKMYMGIELAIPFLTMRGGFFQGYWTAGVSISILPFLDIDAATFAEELNSVGGIRGERQWMLGIKTGLDLSGDGGKKKKKQRYSVEKYY